MRDNGTVIPDYSEGLHYERTQWYITAPRWVVHNYKMIVNKIPCSYALGLLSGEARFAGIGSVNARFTTFLASTVH